MHHHTETKMYITIAKQTKVVQQIKANEQTKKIIKEYQGVILYDKVARTSSLMEGGGRSLVRSWACLRNCELYFGWGEFISSTGMQLKKLEQ